mmetsp:Transcript_13211/g.49395  ORF Transcript_13211/g.49395 Transcript_13211/m.49395 type:complete len:410 (+) Transcript_13211:711-1940(+)
MTSACTCASLVLRSTSSPSTDDVSARSAKDAPCTASTPATRAKARTATNRGSPCSRGNSWCSCAMIAPSSPVSQPGSLRAILSTAIANASWGPFWYRKRNRLRSVAHHFGSVGVLDLPKAGSSSSSSSSMSTASSLSSSLSLRNAASRIVSALCASATPSKDAAAACRGRPDVAPGSIKHVVAPMQRNAASPSETTHPGVFGALGFGFGFGFFSSPGKSPPSPHSLTQGTCLTTGASPPRSSTPAFASAPIICTPHRRASLPCSESARDFDFVVASYDLFLFWEASSPFIKSTAASSAGRSARAASLSTSADDAPDAIASRAAQSASLRFRRTARPMFCLSVNWFRDGEKETTAAASSRSADAISCDVSFVVSEEVSEVVCPTPTSSPVRLCHADSHSSAATASSRNVE